MIKGVCCFITAAFFSFNSFAQSNTSIFKEEVGSSHETVKSNNGDYSKNYKAYDLLNSGINLYNDEDFLGAFKAFKRTIRVARRKRTRELDSLAFYYAGVSAEQIGEFKKAEKYYRRAIAKDYKPESAYIRMERMFAAAGEEDKAFEILKEGRKAFPNNQTMVTDEVNVYLKQDKHAEAVSALEVAIAGEPDNASLHFAYGFVNDRLAAKEIEANPEGGEMYDKYLAQAANSYGKSVELDDSNFDAFYNLGALYFNKAVKMQEAANMIDDIKKYGAAMAEADKVFDKSLPILEKAYAINGEDKGVLIALKQLYYRKMVEDPAYKEKYDEVMAKMKG